MNEIFERPAANAFPAIALSVAQASLHLAEISRDEAQHAVQHLASVIAAREASIEVLRLEPAARPASPVAAFFKRKAASEVHERLRTSGLFLPRWYTNHYRAMVGTGDAWSHYEEHGLVAGLAPNPFFDAGWYAEHYDLSASDTAPILHYVAIGARHGLTPGPLFDPIDYMRRYEDVAGEPDLLAHFLKSGVYEGRVVNPAPPPLPRRT